MVWYERIVEWLLVDLVSVFTTLGEYLFLTPRDFISQIPSIEIYGFDFATTPLLGYVSAYIIYLAIAIKLVRLVVGG